MDHLNAQRAESQHLRLQLQESNRATVDANRNVSAELELAMKEEAQNSEIQRAALLSQISQMKDFVEESTQKRLASLGEKCEAIRAGIASSGDSAERFAGLYSQQADERLSKDERFAKQMADLRQELRTRMQNDLEVG